MVPKFRFETTGGVLVGQFVTGHHGRNRVEEFARDISEAYNVLESRRFVEVKFEDGSRLVATAHIVTVSILPEQSSSDLVFLDAE